MSTDLPAALAGALEQIDLDPGLRRVTVGDREVVAENRKQLRAVLAATLYDVWHVGRPKQEGPVPKAIRDPAFEQTLRRAIPHETSVVAAGVERPAGGTDQDSMVVRLSGIRVRVPVSRLVEGDETGDDALVRIRIPAVLPAMSPGFLMVNGSRGMGELAPCLRVYLHLPAPEPAPAVWGSVLTRLEDLGVAYRAKVTSARWMFPRQDAMVVYLGPDSWGAVPDIRKAAAATGGLGEAVSSYASRLDAGICWAWEPDDPRPGMRGMSFGEHRSHVIATGVLAANGSGDRSAAVATALREARVGPTELYQNVDSPDLPDLGGVNREVTEGVEQRPARVPAK